MPILLGFSLQLVSCKIIRSAPGTKSVVLSPDASKVYAMNLEGLSVYEFDRENCRLLRKLVFVPHAGRGFDYKRKKWIKSLQEKPVEAAFSHGGRFLWISLHNAGGVVVWDLEKGDTWVEGSPFKEAWLYSRARDSDSWIKRKIKLLFIKTGTTPKVMTPSPDGSYLFVANWHSSTVSVIDISSPVPAGFFLLRNLKTGPIPRGLVVSPDSKFLYVANMGSSTIWIYELDHFKKVHTLRVGVNPRHLVLSFDGRYLFVSLNISARILKIDTSSFKIVASSKTARTPRTVCLSPDGRLVFVSCYYGNVLQVFDTQNLKLIGTYKSLLHPVGVTVWQEGNQIEAWVANQTSGTIKIFRFEIKE